MEITARPRRRGWVRVLKVALAAACLVSVALLVPPALGYGVHVVADDAMTSTSPRGSIVLHEQVPAGALAVGDVVTLAPPGDDDLVVRRVLSIDEDGVHTGSDTAGQDPWVVPEADLDRVALTVPALGWPLLAVHAMSWPAWAPAGLALCLAVVLVGLRRVGRHEEGEAPRVAAARVEGVPAAPPTPPSG